MHDFKEVGVGIYKADNSMSSADCDYIYNYMISYVNHPIGDVSVVPWEQEQKNIMFYPMLTDRKFLDIVNIYKAEMAEYVGKIYGEKVYPHLTTIVLWKPNQSMPRHVDDGSGSDTHYEILKMRKFTSITYMNQGYEGGETFIRSDGQITPDFRVDGRYRFPNDFFPDFVSTPTTGTTLLFKGDETNAHGVNPLRAGTRVVLSTWFTDDPVYMEQVL